MALGCQVRRIGFFNFGAPRERAFRCARPEVCIRCRRRRSRASVRRRGSRHIKDVSIFIGIKSPKRFSAGQDPKREGSTSVSSPTTTSSLRRPVTGRFLASSEGATAVEFALIAMPLFLMIIVLFQVGVVCLAQNELETAAERSARLLLTGQAQQANYTQNQFATAVCGYLPALFTCANLMVDVQTVNAFAAATTSAPTLTYNAQGQVTNSWNYSPGASNSVLVLRVMYQFPVIPAGSFSLANLANGSRLLVATSVFQVERY